MNMPGFNAESFGVRDSIQVHDRNARICGEQRCSASRDLHMFGPWM